ncbi:Peroxidase 64 [Triticum urartu]|uniref:Peroxidase 64 n=1 Tax=Triticum urartu TaxID=4572 RepID=M7YMS6_TRIUA|nr:Peroxidase 64 [Triticum urartu]
MADDAAAKKKATDDAEAAAAAAALAWPTEGRTSNHKGKGMGRIHGFRPGADVDPALNPSFAAALRRACPANNTARGAGSGMDSTSATFDNAYYRMLQSGRGLLSSDEVLLTHPKTRRFVALYAARQDAFFRAFVSSMLRMSALNQPGEVRANCRRHN